MADGAGSASAVIFTLAIVIVWVCVGPYFRSSDTWQLVINTASSIITFLMIFLIQNTQNRETREIHLKLDELILVNTTNLWDSTGSLTTISRGNNTRYGPQ
jgi:low affinity Fe/Cu permease